MLVLLIPSVLFVNLILNAVLKLQNPSEGSGLTFTVYSILENIKDKEPPPIQYHHLEFLEERLIAALQLLHDNNISWPVSFDMVEILKPFTTPKLFIPYNKAATRDVDKLPPDWKAKQLSDARYTFGIVKV